MEGRLQRAIDFYHENPDVLVTQLCKTFKVPRKRLRNRIKGIPPKKGFPAYNTKLTAINKKALYNYIDRLDRINFTIRPKFV
ncbi:hypothetical protein QBC45DRAFT_337879 [Copromyces sp. CBS 386.78]|nr:hypothetical protein QBC45DRAFT_337879 [Copromyces sp. CBS 386.78]